MKASHSELERGSVDASQVVEPVHNQQRRFVVGEREPVAQVRHRIESHRGQRKIGLVQATKRSVPCQFRTWEIDGKQGDSH